MMENVVECGCKDIVKDIVPPREGTQMEHVAMVINVENKHGQKCTSGDAPNEVLHVDARTVHRSEFRPRGKSRDDKSNKPFN